MKEVEFVRTDSSNTHFQALVRALDQDLKDRYGDKQSFFDQFNSVEAIRNVIVAKSGGRYIGCGAIKRFDDRTAEIKRMFVAPESRGSGVGRGILSGLEQWASELGFDRCILETGKYQPEAIAVYSKCGYTAIPNYPPYVGVELSLCMEKRLE